jgi:hypothetical protein
VDRRILDNQPSERGTTRRGCVTIGGGASRGSCLMRGIDCCATGGGHGAGVPADGGATR